MKVNLITIFDNGGCNMLKLRERLLVILGICSFVTCMNTQAQQTTTTEVNPVTQESTTTTVNPATNASTTTTVKSTGETTTNVEDANSATQTMSTTVNPTTKESTTTTVNPVTHESTTTNVNPATQQTTVTESNPNTGISKVTIISAAPLPQETVVVPEGYVKCFNVASGWYKDKWVSEHKVCQYDPSKGKFQGAEWVDGHWTCIKYRASEGVCTKWIWRPSRWVSTGDVY